MTILPVRVAAAALLILAPFAAPPAPPRGDDLPFVFRATHNSYSGDIGGARGSIPQQLDAGVRYVELDTWNSPYASTGDYGIGHGSVGDQVDHTGGNPATNQLRAWLTTVGTWSTGHPAAAPITVMLDLKGDPTTRASYATGNFAALNQEIADVFGPRPVRSLDTAGPLGLAGHRPARQLPGHRHPERRLVPDPPRRRRLLTLPLATTCRNLYDRLSLKLREAPMQALVDRADLIQLFGRYADIADLKEFTDLPGRVFTDPLTLDFESVTGMPPMTVPLGAYVENLRSAFAPFAATHHVITGHVVDLDGDHATIHAHVRAEHWLTDGPDRWLVVGFYDNEAVRTADGWRLSRVRLTATHQENPPALAG